MLLVLRLRGEHRSGPARRGRGAAAGRLGSERRRLERQDGKNGCLESGGAGCSERSLVSHGLLVVGTLATISSICGGRESGRALACIVPIRQNGKRRGAITPGGS
jgi:hypothetical protein